MPLTAETSKAIFNSIKSCLQNCTPPMVVSKDKASVFELIGNKPIPYGSKKVIVPGMYFSSVVMRKDMISFYFFPMYFHTEEFTGLIPTMVKTLKGKTCFNIKKAEQVNEKELMQMLQKGVKAWKAQGYLQEELITP
jgi:hypothetical protein